MSLMKEFQSIEAFLRDKFAAITVVKHVEPSVPANRSFLLRLNSDTRKSETQLHIRTEREYLIQLWTDSAEMTLETMDSLSTSLYQTQLIPIVGTARFVRVGSFTFAQPTFTSNNLFTCTGTLRTEGREARTQKSYEKIQHVYAQQIIL